MSNKDLSSFGRGVLIYYAEEVLGLRMINLSLGTRGWSSQWVEVGVIDKPSEELEANTCPPLAGMYAGMVISRGRSTHAGTP